jgi:hypothetical protein
MAMMIESQGSNPTPCCTSRDDALSNVSFEGVALTFLALSSKLKSSSTGCLWVRVLLASKLSPHELGNPQATALKHDEQSTQNRYCGRRRWRS